MAETPVNPGEVPPQVWAIVGVIVSAVGAYLVAVRSSRAQQEQTSGELALEIAKEARLAATEAVRKGDRLERRVNSFRRFWTQEHEPWDANVRLALQRADPDAARDLPAPPTPPLWDDDETAQ
jgi:hypothetical protein